MNDAIAKLKAGAEELRKWARDRRQKKASDLWDGRAEHEADHLEFAAWWLEHNRS